MPRWRSQEASGLCRKKSRPWELRARGYVKAQTVVTPRGLAWTVESAVSRQARMRGEWLERTSME